jgi:hypothetical protein
LHRHKPLCLLAKALPVTLAGLLSSNLTCPLSSRLKVLLSPIPLVEKTVNS